MGFKKSIGQFLLVMMLAMQLALAHHATVHFAEDAYQSTSQTQHPQDHDQVPSKDKLCQICLLSKDSTKILTLTDVHVAAPVIAGTQIIAIQQAFTLKNFLSPYTAHAPPAFSA